MLLPSELDRFLASRFLYNLVVFQLLYFLSAVFLLLNIFDFPGKSAKESSAFYNITYKVIPLTIDFLTNYTPRPKKNIDEIIIEPDTTG